MNLNEYQLQAEAFARYLSGLYPFMALVEEAGEAAGKVAKSLRKSGTQQTLECLQKDPELRVALIYELGDVLWQLSACCSVMGITLEHVAQVNIDKLRDRSTRNVLVGEGDHR